ncbi:MAG: two-component system response regulator DesR [Paracrocinitomix sp.]|jgi:two-component system response regulator DesR
MKNREPLPTNADNILDVFSVIVADDDDNVRSALASLLDEHDGLRLAGLSDSGSGAADLCAEVHPELAVVDVMMPTGGCDAVTAIHQVSPDTVVVAYTARGDRRTREQLMECGMAEVFVKGGGVDLSAALYDLMQRT